MRNYLRLSQVLNKALIQLSRYNMTLLRFCHSAACHVFRLLSRACLAVCRCCLALDTDYVTLCKGTCQYFFMTFHKFLFDALFCVSRGFLCLGYKLSHKDIKSLYGAFKAFLGLFYGLHCLLSEVYRAFQRCTGLF